MVFHTEAKLRELAGDVHSSVSSVIPTRCQGSTSVMTAARRSQSMAPTTLKPDAYHPYSTWTSAECPVRATVRKK